MASVCLEGVSKVFANGAAAVKNLNLEVADEELVVLVGPSGCGKSTTLRMIAGLESPTEGEIKIGGRVVTGAAPKDRDIAMVFQNYALYPHMTVYKNMAFGLQLRYGSNWIARIWRRVTRPAVEAEMAAQRRAIRPRVEQAANTLGIEHLLGRMPRQLSGGERQRVALGRAIVRQPAAFLFDEPLSNLDAKLRLEMRRELNQLHRQLKATMVYVTHDQTEALTLGDRVAVMKEGEIQQIGSPLEVYDRPRNRFVAGFIGAPPMNFVSGAIRRSGESLEFVGQGIRVPLTNEMAERIKAQHNQLIDREVVLGARPEDTQAAATTQPGASPAGQGVVSVIEALGDATLVHLEIAAATDAAAPQNLVSKMNARVSLQPGDAVEFSINASRAHLFDAVTGDNLSLGAS